MGISNRGKLTTNWMRAGACAIESVLRVCACAVHTHPPASLRATALRA
jgi:hypothetical protein